MNLAHPIKNSFKPGPNASARLLANPATLVAWQDARFGLFLHWGLYSLAAGQWKGSWVATDGPWKGRRFSEFLQLQARVPIAEYEDFARAFAPDAFDADEWVRTAIAAGFRYLVFTAKHHEGFAMYRSEVSSFNIVDHSGFPRDPLSELAHACALHGLPMGIYYSLGRDWHDPDTPTDWPVKGGRSNTWDFPDEDAKVFERYFRRKALPQVRELLTRYGPLATFWFDTPEQITSTQSRELLEMIRSLQPACLVNDRVGRSDSGLGDFQTHEQTVPESVDSRPWEACATLGKNWGYHPQDLDWKSPEHIVRLLTDVVSKNGNLLFNIGPRGDGSFPQGAAEHLRQVGDWLAVNSSAVYGSRPWRIHLEAASGWQPADPSNSLAGMVATPPSGEASDTVSDGISRSLTPDLRFTTGADGALYLIARSWMADVILTRMLGRNHIGPIQTVRLLGSPEKILWQQTDDHLKIHFPAHRPGRISVWVFRLVALNPHFD